MISFVGYDILCRVWYPSQNIIFFACFNILRMVLYPSQGMISFAGYDILRMVWYPSQGMISFVGYDILRRVWYPSQGMISFVGFFYPTKVMKVNVGYNFSRTSNSAKMSELFQNVYGEKKSKNSSLTNTLHSHLFIMIRILLKNLFLMPWDQKNSSDS